MNSDNRKESFKLLGLSGSDSGSDIPEFTIPRRKVKIKKKFRASNITARPNGIRHVRGCSAVFIFKILGVLVVAIGLGITVWLAVTLLIKVDELKKQYLLVEESNKGTASEFHGIHSQLNGLQKNHTALKDDVAQLNKTLETMLKELATLTKTSADLRKSVAEAPQLEKLPKNVNELTDSVALLGSQINSLQSNLGPLKDQLAANDKENQELKSGVDALKKKVDTLVLEQHNLSETKSPPSAGNIDITKLQETLADTNNSIWQKLQWAETELHDHQKIITYLQNLAQNLTQRIIDIEAFPINTSSIAASVLQEVQTQVKALVNATFESHVDKIMPDSLPTLGETNGTITINALLSYLRDLTQLYVTLVAKSQALPKEQLHVLNETLSINLAALVQETVSGYVNVSISQQDARIKELLTSITALTSSYQTMKQSSDEMKEKMSVLRDQISKIGVENQTLPQIPVGPPELPRLTTAKASPGTSTEQTQPSARNASLAANETLPSTASAASASTPTPTLTLNGTTAGNSSAVPGHIQKPSITGGSLPGEDEAPAPKSGPATN